MLNVLSCLAVSYVAFCCTLFHLVLLCYVFCILLLCVSFFVVLFCGVVMLSLQLFCSCCFALLLCRVLLVCFIVTLSGVVLWCVFSPFIVFSVSSKVNAYFKLWMLPVLRDHQWSYSSLWYEHAVASDSFAFLVLSKLGGRYSLYGLYRNTQFGFSDVVAINRVSILAIWS